MEQHHPGGAGRAVQDLGPLQPAVRPGSSERQGALLKPMQGLHGELRLTARSRRAPARRAAATTCRAAARAPGGPPCWRHRTPGRPGATRPGPASCTAARPRTASRPPPAPCGWCRTKGRWCRWRAAGSPRARGPASRGVAGCGVCQASGAMRERGCGDGALPRERLTARPPMSRMGWPDRKTARSGRGAAGAAPAAMAAAAAASRSSSAAGRRRPIRPGIQVAGAGVAARRCVRGGPRCADVRGRSPLPTRKLARVCCLRSRAPLNAAAAGRQTLAPSPGARGRRSSPPPPTPNKPRPYTTSRNRHTPASVHLIQLCLLLSCAVNTSSRKRASVVYTGHW